MRKKTLVGVAAACMAVALGTGALGAPLLTSIGALEPGPGGTHSSAVYALSPDGTWAVGASTGANLAGTGAMSQAVIWSSATGLVQAPNDPAPFADQATSARGVVVSGQQLIVGGFYYNEAAEAYRMAYYAAPLANPAGGTWTAMQQNGPMVGQYNAVRTKTRHDGSDEIVVAGRRASRPSGMAAVVGSSLYYEYQSTSTSPPGAEATINSLARVPRNPSGEHPVGAGWDTGNPGGARRAICFTGAAATQTIITGGSGIYSEAYGLLPESTQAAATVVGYDRDAGGTPHAFVWSTGAPMTLLAELSGGQSVATDLRRIESNLIIGGSAYVGNTEHAVLWDSTGIWNATGQPVVLSDMLAAAGIPTADWASLTRITSLADDGMTVAGYGVWAADGSTRGFVAVIPEPVTLTLFGLALAWVPRRRN